ncbi:RCC1 domain-containing protein [Stigmatella ashevillensis]|uniref:RCC1 domain-containing protein n=1 Tax=Stigmatella ashevillensis TaxID=2995309 RepID=UPI004033034E
MSIVASSDFSVAMQNDGSVWVWGLGASRALIPVQIPELAGSTSLSIEGSTLYALYWNGSVWKWDLSKNGTQPEPFWELSNVASLSLGDSSSFAVRTDGTVWSWGENEAGQLGDGTRNFRSAPAPSPGLTGMISLSTSFDHTFALRADGTVWAWGSNSEGVLGIGWNDHSIMLPAQVTSP